MEVLHHQELREKACIKTGSNVACVHLQQKSHSAKPNKDNDDDDDDAIITRPTDIVITAALKLSSCKQMFLFSLTFVALWQHYH